MTYLLGLIDRDVQPQRKRWHAVPAHWHMYYVRENYALGREHRARARRFSSRAQVLAAAAPWREHWHVYVIRVASLRATRA